MAGIYTFSEHSLTVSGEKYDLLMLTDYLEGVEMENTWSDLIHQIKMELDKEYRKAVNGGADHEVSE